MLIIKPTCYRTFKKASQGQPIPSANFIYQKNGSSQDGYCTPNKGGVEFKAVSRFLGNGRPEILPQTKAYDRVPQTIRHRKKE